MKAGPATQPAAAPRTARPVLSPLPPSDSGLQLLSDDPVWLNKTAPALRRLPVTYQVRLRRTADAALVARLKRGVTDFGEFLAATEARLLDGTGSLGWLEITLNHGKSTTVRRLFSAFGIGVEEVRRTRVGPIQLGSLAFNEQRSLTENERAALPGARIE